MNLLELPEEMIGEILKRLDTKSKMCVWYTCKTLRHSLKQSRLMRRVALLDESDIRRHSFLAELGTYVEELDLSGFESLTGEPAKSVVRLCPNLRSLDVTQTNISALHVSDLCDLCPHLKRLAACFDFPYDKFPMELSVNSDRYRRFVEKCQRAFRGLEDIHFIYDSCSDCDHPMQVINVCDSLRHLRLDLIHKLPLCNHHFECSTRMPPTLMTFVVKISDGFAFPSAIGHMRYIDIQDWQGVLVNEDEHLEPHFSMTEKLLKKHTSTAHYEQLEWNSPNIVLETSHLFMWHSDLERRRPDLYDEIVRRVYAQTPHVVCRREGRCADRSCTRFLVKRCVLLPDPCARRGYPKLLNLDEWMEPPVGGQPVRVSTTNSPCRCRNNFQIYPTSEPLLQFDFRSTALLNLSYLSIRDCMLEPSAAIVLFENCKNLQTLLLIWMGLNRSGYSEILKNINLSGSIQNVMCVDQKMNVSESVLGLARCPKLRHVHLACREQDPIICLPTDQMYCDLLVGCPDMSSFTLHFTLQSEDLLYIYRNQKPFFESAMKQLQRNVSVFISDYHSLMNVTANRYCDEFNISDTSNLFRDINLKYD